MIRSALPVLSVLVITACSSTPERLPQFDPVIRNGTVYDGSGGAGVNTDVSARDDLNVAVGELAGSPTRKRPAAR